uniref:beta-galactoside alpha-(2,6)-sialyltransferase n=1 Tax=Tetraselmis sp. GSL018 TaxID=582737 RepID=A0A061RB19_9CHLO
MTAPGDITTRIGGHQANKMAWIFEPLTKGALLRGGLAARRTDRGRCCGRAPEVGWASRLLGAVGGISRPSRESRGSGARLPTRGNRQLRVLPCFGTAFEDVNSLTLNQFSAQRRGSAAGPVRHPPVSQGLLSKLPPLPFRGNSSQAFRSCAVVGNSPGILRNKWQDEIDKHDLVARCNNAPTKNHRPHVGSWTSFRYQNERYSGFREFGYHRLHVGSWTSFRYQNERYSGFREFGEPTIGRYCSTVNVKGMVPCGKNKLSSSLKSKELQYMLKKKMHPLNPLFDAWIERPFREKKTMPSTGMRGVLLHICEKIDVYGFGGASGSFREWYWNKYKGFKGKPPVSTLKRKFPKMIQKTWSFPEWRYASLHRYPANQGSQTFFNGRRKLLGKKSSKKKSKVLPSEHKRGIEDKCLGKLQSFGVINLRR